MNRVAEILFDYLKNVIYDPANATLDMEMLPGDFRDFGNGLRYFAECVMETKSLAQSLAKGDLNGKIPSPGNEIASPLKSLHASLRHLTWQTQQVAEGDYQQRVKFMGDFATAFNSMAQQLEERKQSQTREKSKLQQYINMILANMPNIMLVFDAEGKTVLASEAYLYHVKAETVCAIQNKT
ncbi:MAG: cell wall metabolism sensor histidine kinase WalK, partial [Clostridiales bacterium]|nr:cell wall metabolism sensor histidine kinase WalK [Clostridiales bacterium]